MKNEKWEVYKFKVNVWNQSIAPFICLNIFFKYFHSVIFVSIFLTIYPYNNRPFLLPYIHGDTFKNRKSTLLQILNLKSLEGFECVWKSADPLGPSKKVHDDDVFNNYAEIYPLIFISL